MTRNAADSRLIAALADGLPLDPRPFAALARTVGIDEDEAIARLRRMVDDGAIKRFGLVVRHHELGYCANAMVVWDAPDDHARRAGRRLARNRDVSLCYRRARHANWPYNLYVMIHGRDRAAVLASVDRIEAEAGLAGLPRKVLFSRRRFKQTGARYRKAEVA